MRWTPLWKVSGSGLIKQLTNPDFKGKTPLNRHPPDEFLRSARMAWTVAFSKSVLVGTATSAGVEAEEIAQTKLHRTQGSALRWPLSRFRGMRRSRSLSAPTRIGPQETTTPRAFNLCFHCGKRTFGQRELQDLF